jgi:hypothetical protein
MAITSITDFPEKTFEIDKLADDLKLTFAAGFYENEATTTPATSIVYTGETYYVKVAWKLEGKLAAHFCGKWLVKVDLESIGIAPEFSFPLESIDMEPCKTGEYSHVFKVTPDTVKPAQGGTVYLVAATLSSEDPCGMPGHIWAYATGVSVMFVQGKPD